jgi:N-acetylglutamate synthase-like GNAT family acetyltransferase
MIIREYKIEEKDKIKDFIIGVIKEIYNSQEVFGIDDLENIEKEYEIFLVVERNGEIVGTAGIKNEGDARLKRMYVKKDEIGKGIGEELIKKSIEHCKGKFNRIFLTTHEQIGSVDFYKKMGFEVFKVDEKIWLEKIID